VAPVLELFSLAKGVFADSLDGALLLCDDKDVGVDGADAEVGVEGAEDDA
jgi:hypothetical protein